MAKFDAQRSLAARLVAKFGTSGVIVTQKTDANVTDPATETATQATTTESFTAVRLPPGRNAQYELGTLKKERFEEFYFDMKGKTIVPGPGDTVVFAGDTYTLFWHYKIAPDGGAPVFVRAYGER